MGKRRKRPGGPPPVNGCDAFDGEAGPIVYTYPMPPVKSRGRLLFGNEVQLIDAEPSKSPGDVLSGRATADARPLLPASEEVATLPKLAREAFASRCAARVAPLRAGATTPEAVAALLLAAAIVDTPIRRQLLCVRRDFDRLARLAKMNAWTDDTPVPADVFGPLWPNGLTPDWAKEPS